ncbi:MAG TPA: aspartate dehydrogenase [Candidatus Blautia merdavium]|uniref:Aspartate dehydrogenase n=1 Tax=Candidatus Blautia merdavium TaxID=2838494 RepID=A0A9D2PL27_9FIRM|nr:aspartate dehydrogenase [Candidatus Blautia merdavium]
MFFRKKAVHSSPSQEFDRNKMVPVIRSSICTGEKTAGFKNLETGRFEDIMLIRQEKDLQEFLDLYGISKEEIRTEY